MRSAYGRLGQRLLRAEAVGRKSLAERIAACQLRHGLSNYVSADQGGVHADEFAEVIKDVG